jgi:hypothetical protein
MDEVAREMTVVAVHPDSASLELHMQIGSEEFRKRGHLLRPTGIECYGRPSERALDQLRQKAAALGDGRDGRVHRSIHGIHAHAPATT